MLEQNTDRLYWIIGAVVVGSLLIFVAYKYFPDLFQKSIKEKFEELLGTSDKSINGIKDYNTKDAK